MVDNDFEQFSSVWASCWMITIGRKPDPTVLDLAFEVLKRYDLEDIQKALTAHLNDPDTGQYAPKPADVVRQIDGSKGARSARAWTKVLNAIKHVGAYQDIVFDDPTIHAVINDLGGWIKLCEVTEKELPFKAREFETRYQSYALHGTPGKWPDKLIGIASAHNRAEGFEIEQEPVLIGNEERALRVLEQGSDSGAVKITRSSGFLKNINMIIDDSRNS